MAECQKTLVHYKEILHKALTQGYAILPLSEYARSKESKKVLFLRHDVDIDLRNAKILADIETSLGIRATYFFRVHGPYNLFHKDCYAVLMHIAKSHEVALHHEAETAPFFSSTAEKLLADELHLLKLITKKDIKGISRHRAGSVSSSIPRSHLASLGVQYDAYDDLYVKDCKYISDSANHWREGCACSWIGKTDRLCVLTHPLWWHTGDLIEHLESLVSPFSRQGGGHDGQ